MSPILIFFVKCFFFSFSLSNIPLKTVPPLFHWCPKADQILSRSNNLRKQWVPQKLILLYSLEFLEFSLTASTILYFLFCSFILRLLANKVALQYCSEIYFCCACFPDKNISYLKILTSKKICVRTGTYKTLYLLSKSAHIEKILPIRRFMPLSTDLYNTDVHCWLICNFIEKKTNK